MAREKFDFSNAVKLYEIKHEGGPHIIVLLDKAVTPEEIPEVHRRACKRLCEATGASSYYYNPDPEYLKRMEVDGELPWWVCRERVGYEVPNAKDNEGA